MQPSRTELENDARRGLEAMEAGDFTLARSAFERVAAAGGATPQLWLLLADARNKLDDREATHAALDRVLEAEPRNLFALLMKGDLYSRSGDDRAAVSYYRLALSSAAAATALPGDLPQRLERAAAAVAAAERKFEEHLTTHLATAGIHDVPRRLAEAIDIASGRREIYLQQPTSFYYPGLPQIAWYDAGDFEWAAALEARWQEMRAEIEAVLCDEQGVEPYVHAQKDRPSRGHSLLNDKRWSAFYLWRDGKPVEDHARRCPVTMELLELPPIPRVKGRSPMAMVSILRAGTHIPPHTGMLNSRLICHLPLVVPPGCRLRVGAETRTVEAGKMMIFDDSIEHEAWNDSDAVRAVLLFEIWRPELSEDERRALAVAYEAIGAYPSG